MSVKSDTKVPHLRLAAVNGRHVENVPARSMPETTLVVSFQGLTEAEQRKALAAFPGGSRFKLEREAG